jgi:hypothetical protein
MMAFSKVSVLMMLSSSEDRISFFSSGQWMQLWQYNNQAFTIDSLINQKEKNRNVILFLSDIDSI